MKDPEKEIKELKKEVSELKVLVEEVLKIVKADLSHTQGLYGKIDEIKNK